MEDADALLSCPGWLPAAPSDSGEGSRPIRSLLSTRVLATSRLLPVPFRRWLLHWRWHRLRRRGRTLRLGVGGVREFLETLNRDSIRYVVLRWFDEVPGTPEAEETFVGDVDLMVQGDQLESVVRVAARFPGPVKFDVYSPTGRRGSAFAGMPYYPPVLAMEILANRVPHERGFWVPPPALHFKSLAYHLVYHKGLEAGLPTGAELVPSAAPQRDYAAGLAALIRELGVPLHPSCTLLELHEYLKSQQWSMPHDLMVRWPKQHGWMQWLARHEEAPLAGPAQQLPHLIVFLLRADAMAEPVRADALAALRERFQLLQTVDLDSGQIQRVMRSVRGGNWIEHGHTTLLEPRVAVICNDPHPQPIAAEDPRRVRYPRVVNQNVFFKEEVRARLNRLFPRQPRLIALHGSDNAIEAQHYLEAIFGDRYAEVWPQLVPPPPRPTPSSES